MASVEPPLFTVSGFLASVNQTLEYAYPSVEIEGEVASFKVNQGKFVFFDLKDGEGSLGCFMTVWQLRQPIEDGMTVVVRAVPKLTAWGKFSLTIQSIRPKGEGALKKSFELLKKKLTDEGLFAEERKRSLPRIPRHIGVISSTQAAGYADFVTILNNRWGGVLVETAHVQVQGEVAPDQMIRAINYFNQQEQLPEVLVLIRGGGSADDLAWFNDEKLVRAIARSRIPTLVGVGHETDETLSDLVADVRAVTPSDAARIIVPDRYDIVNGVRHTMSKIAGRCETGINELAREMGGLVRNTGETTLRRVEQLIDAVHSCVGRLDAYDPERVLVRGYAIVRGAVVQGGTLEIETRDNNITAEVKHVKAKRTH